MKLNSDIITITNLECSLTKNLKYNFHINSIACCIEQEVILCLGLLLISILVLSCLSTSIFNLQDRALALLYIPTIKYRNLVIDLGNGVKTKAQLTFPATGKGPFPAVVLIQGSGAVDMNSTLTKNAKPFWEIAQYLSERGFAVLRYDKRGVGATSYTVSNSNV